MDATSAIRAAIESGDYAEALRLWNGYAARLRNDSAGGALSQAGLTEAFALLEWSRAVLLCARAHLLDRMNSAYVAGIYAGR